MSAIPNATVLVERPTEAEDAYGDPVPGSWTTVSAAVAVSLGTRTEAVWDPAEGRWGSVSFYEASVPASLGVQAGDRLTTATGREFLVAHVYDLLSVVAPGVWSRLRLEDLSA